MTLEQLREFASSSSDLPGSGVVVLTREQVRDILSELEAEIHLDYAFAESGR